LITFYTAREKFDIDNHCKIIFDAATGIVFEDDMLIYQKTVNKCISQTTGFTFEVRPYFIPDAPVKEKKEKKKPEPTPKTSNTMSVDEFKKQYGTSKPKTISVDEFKSLYRR
jgi:hypothetical protein